VLPTFVIIGAQKAATTSLYHYLRAHPQVYLPELKETNFFAAEGNWHLGRDWYESLYEPARDTGRLQLGDVSPGYTMYPYFAGVPERMASVIPDAKLIYVLREPATRAHSSYLQNLTEGLERRRVEEALFDGRYLLVSCYALQLEQYLEHFDRSQLLILSYEELASDPEGTFGRLLGFLELDTDWDGADMSERHNVSEGKRVPRRRTVVAERLLGRVGSERAVQRLREAGKRAPRLSRELSPAEATLDPDLRERLRRCFVADAGRLRGIVGPDPDLWGLA
jgi:sulfotransferase family protein